MKKQSIIFISMLTLVNVTKPMDPVRLNAAQMALNMCGDSRNINTLIDIKETELKNVKKLADVDAEAYYADLSNEDYLSVKYFHKGPLAEKFVCMRCVRTVNHSLLLPLDSKYFHILKKISEQQNNN